MIPLICEKLTTGHLTAIDRSEKMAVASLKTYSDLVDEGNASILGQELLDRKLAAHHFDKIFLYNINVFWMDPREELAEIRRLLKTHGRFYLFHQPPPGHDLDEFEYAFRKNLTNNQFHLVQDLKDRRDEVRSVAMIAELSLR